MISERTRFAARGALAGFSGVPGVQPPAGAPPGGGAEGAPHVSAGGGDAGAAGAPHSGGAGVPASAAGGDSNPVGIPNPAPLSAGAAG
ncbi:MAG: hypothetical protein ACRDGI_08620 [Candidatus Limnocylindrales bacterium]